MTHSTDEYERGLQKALEIAKRFPTSACGIIGLIEQEIENARTARIQQMTEALVRNYEP